MLEKYLIDEEYSSVLNLFREHNIKYVLFKQSYIANSRVAGLDIVFRSDAEYQSALDLLSKEGFMDYLTEKNEPYKTMIVKLQGDFLLILHLHRKISWYGIVFLDPKYVFNKVQRKNDLVVIPSDENQLIIHVAHILFENFKVKRHEYEIISSLLSKNLDWIYINSVLSKYGWKSPFYKFSKLFKKIDNKEIIFPYKVNKNLILKSYVSKFFNKDLLRNLFFISKQSFNFVSKRSSLKRKGSLIVFSGVNGSGKTTLGKKCKSKYNFLFENLNLLSESYYFGWRPFFPWTKVISKNLKKNRKSIYDDSINNVRIPKFNLRLELLFLYVFFEDTFRYLFHIYPKLRKRNLVISDRYFYRMYGQYPYARNSLLMPALVKLFPKPDHSFLLNVNIDTLSSRRKDQTLQNLEEQIYNYNKLSDYVQVSRIDNDKNFDKNLDNVTKKTWRTIFRSLKY